MSITRYIQKSAIVVIAGPLAYCWPSVARFLTLFDRHKKIRNPATGFGFFIVGERSMAP
ncbi:TPA: hypothetical protein SIA31_001160 [Aeromonas sobria]|nr:hypothetical protein [Aeromonas sobria]